MNRLVLLALVAFTAQACSRPHYRPAPVSPAIHADTAPVQASPNVPVHTAPVRVERVDTVSPSQSRAIQRANQAAGLVETLQVHPDSLVLHVGQAIPLFESLTIDARDASGARVQDFAPAISIQDRTIVDLEQTRLIGRQPGTTHLLIRPYSSDPSITTKPIRILVAVRVDP